jgi:pilus assembly protein Flp/PilA
MTIRRGELLDIEIHPGPRVWVRLAWQLHSQLDYLSFPRNAGARGRVVNSSLDFRKETPMTALWARLMREDAGQDLIEYGLLVGLITALVAATITTIGTKVQTYFTTLNSNLP